MSKPRQRLVTASGKLGVQGDRNDDRIFVVAGNDRRLFRRLGGFDSLLRRSDGQGRPVMNWIYWVSGLAAMGIFIYLIIALFKPEFFE